VPQRRPFPTRDGDAASCSVMASLRTPCGCSHDRVERTIHHKPGDVPFVPPLAGFMGMCMTRLVPVVFRQSNGASAAIAGIHALRCLDRPDESDFVGDGIVELGQSRQSAAATLRNKRIAAVSGPGRVSVWPRRTGSPTLVSAPGEAAILPGPRRCPDCPALQTGAGGPALWDVPLHVIAVPRDRPPAQA
jgi:hypothetical protein